MATDRVNLLPKDMKTGREPNLQGLVIAAWIVGVTLMAAATYLKATETKAKEQKLTESSIVDTVNAEIQRIAIEARVFEAANIRLNVTKKIMEERMTWTDAFKELSLLLPEKVWLTNLTTRFEEQQATIVPVQAPAVNLPPEFSSQKAPVGAPAPVVVMPTVPAAADPKKPVIEQRPVLTLVGEASSQQKVAEFLAALEGSFHFRKVIMKSSQRLSDIVPDLYRFTFEIEIPQLAREGKHAKAH